LSDAVVLFSSALLPMAVFVPPVVLSNKAYKPKAALFEPVVLL
jgi:hypothetical protein